MPTHNQARPTGCLRSRLMRIAGLGLLALTCLLVALCQLPALTKSRIEAPLLRGIVPRESLSGTGFQCPGAVMTALPVLTTTALPVLTTLTQSSHILQWKDSSPFAGTISPDGTRLLRLSSHEVSIYDPITLRHQRSIQYPAPIIGYNPDLTLVATYATPTLTLWELETGAQRAVVEVDQYPADARVFVSNDGTVVVIGTKEWGPYQADGRRSIAAAMTDVWDVAAATRRYSVPEQALQLGPQDQYVLTQPLGDPLLHGIGQLRAYHVQTGALQASYDVAPQDAEYLTYYAVATTEPCVLMLFPERITGWNLLTNRTYDQPRPLCRKCPRRTVYSATGQYGLAQSSYSNRSNWEGIPSFGPPKRGASVLVSDVMGTGVRLAFSRHSSWEDVRIADAFITPDEQALIVLTGRGGWARINLQTATIEASTLWHWTIIGWLLVPLGTVGGVRLWRWLRRRQSLLTSPAEAAPDGRENAGSATDG